MRKRENNKWRVTARARSCVLLLGIGLLLPASLAAATRKTKDAETQPPSVQVWPPPPEPTRIEYLRTFSRAKDFGWKPSLWRKFVEWAKYEKDPSLLQTPFAIALDGPTRMIIADAGSRDVKIFDFQKKTVRPIRGYKKTYFGSPVGVAVDQEHNIYVSDSSAGRVVKFSRDGKLLSYIGGEEGAFKRPAGIAFNPTNELLYVVDTLRPRIFVYDSAGTLVRQFGEPGNGPGQFNYPTFVAVDREGQVYVNDTLNFRIQVFTPDGHFVRMMGTQGDGSGQFSRAKGMAFDSEGHMYVADALFAAVQIFGGDGSYLLTFGASGAGPGEFYLPAGVAVDESDQVYVADPYQRRVEVFRYIRENEAKPRFTPGGSQ